jgi:hypothetical protein
MLACMCSTIPGPQWFPIVPIALIVTAVVALGIAHWTTTRAGRHELRGALCIAGSIVLVLASIGVAHAARTSVTIEDAAAPAGDPGWLVVCESALAAGSGEPGWPEEHRQACADATAGERTAVYALLGLAGLLLVVGTVSLWPGPRRRTGSSDADRAAAPATVAG